LEYKGNTYTREENIINGKIHLSWMLKKMNGYGTWDDVGHVTDQTFINKLNGAYSDMSYSENFAK
jgi:hypothetical protein